jgi:hypothetical protein
LSKENDQLKREIEKLKSQQERKQQQLLPSASAKASILKPNAPAIIELPTPSVSQPIIAEGLPSRTVIVNNDEKHGAQYATSS